MSIQRVAAIKLRIKELCPDWDVPSDEDEKAIETLYKFGRLGFYDEFSMFNGIKQKEEIK